MRSSLKQFAVVAVAFAAAMACTVRAATHMMEYLDRGVIAVRTSATDVFISWRVLGTDPTDVSFNLYRTTGAGAPVLLSGSPFTGGTNVTDSTADLTQTNAYSVRAIIGGVEQPATGTYTLAASAPI